jgi:hypothetical protein
MKWITRARPKTDRIACPWLIRRFIDPDAETIYVPADQVLATAAAHGGYSFDVKDATYTHRGTKCTFEVLIDEYHLDADPAMVRLARIVHAADIADDVHTGPFGPSLLAIGEGGLAVEDDDRVLLDRGSFVYDACTPGAGTTSTASGRRPPRTEAAPEIMCGSSGRVAARTPAGGSRRRAGPRSRS